MSDKKHIAILGSTGSIGTQALDVVRKQSEHFEVEVLDIQQQRRSSHSASNWIHPNAVVIGDVSKTGLCQKRAVFAHVKVFAGEEALAEIVEMDQIDMVLTALVGYAGLKPTPGGQNCWKTHRSCKQRNISCSRRTGDSSRKGKKAVNIYPVDSKHSAIFSVHGWRMAQSDWKFTSLHPVVRSGGKTGIFVHCKKEQAPKHPNWDREQKITIDSCVTMNEQRSWDDRSPLVV